MAYQWVDPNDYPEQFESFDVLNWTDPSNFIPGIPEDGNGLWNAPFGIEGFDPWGVPTPCDAQDPSASTIQLIPPWIFCEGSPPPPIDLATLPPTITDPYTQTPGTLPASMVFREGVWSDPIPPTPRLPTIPLPPYTPGHDTWGPGDFYGGDDDFLAQEAEMSRSLATAKPEYIENDARARSSSPAASSSGGGYNRTRNAKEKVLRLAQIREVLGIPSTEDELLTLQTIIQFLGGTVPEIEDPPTWLTKPQRATRNRRARRACFEEVKRLVGPHTDKLYELKVLDHALESLTNRGGGPSGSRVEYEPYGVFHAW